jgi:hypothetical protein
VPRRGVVLVLVVVLPAFADVPDVERASLARPTLSIKRKLRRTGLRRAQSSRCPRIRPRGVMVYWPARIATRSVAGGRVGVTRQFGIAPRVRGVGSAFRAECLQWLCWYTCWRELVITVHAARARFRRLWWIGSEKIGAPYWTNLSPMCLLWSGYSAWRTAPFNEPLYAASQGRSIIFSRS